MMFQVDASCGAFLGNGRGNNEDNFYFNKKHLPASNKGLSNPLQYCTDTTNPVLLAVFDGMGGGVKGEEASCRASEIFAEEYKTLEELAFSGKDFLISACRKANEAVNQLSEAHQAGTMGTTVAAIYFSQDEVIACNVGDSKIFRIRNNQMMQISEDHTDEKIMSAMGIQKKPVLLQYLGVSEADMTIEPSISKGNVEEGDIFILCSDGVSDVLSPEQIYEIVCGNNTEDAVRTILMQVSDAGGMDNATAIVAKINK